jgi:hypothetical protein
MIIEFSGILWYWRGPAPWFFVAVPTQHSRDLKAIVQLVTYGWGMIPVQVQIGQSTWETSLFPKDGDYLVPIKASIRKTEQIKDGETIHLRLDVRW